MAVVYLTPSDLNAAQAVRVLDFLNRAQTPQEIATRIEISDELDVGMRVSQHILDARANLGGRFETLQQLRGVRSVGPERFTEIVAVLAGIPLPQFSPTALNELVQQEFARHAASAVAPAASAAYIIEVINPAQALVGASHSVTVKVLDAITREPIPNLIVILEAMGAVLRTQFGFETRQGEVISSITGVDGTVRLSAQVDTAQNLAESQRIALTQALDKLDADAAAPQQLQNSLVALSTQYDNERETAFRNAVDIHFQAVEDQIVGAINQQDFLHQWQYYTVLLRIYVQRPPVGVEAQNTAIAAQGVHILRWKNWLLPWAQIYTQSLSNTAGLDKAFANAKQRTQDGYSLTNTIIDTAHTFVATQRGRVAEKLGQQIAGKAMQTFLATQINDLPESTQRTLFPSLNVASKSIRAADKGALGLVSQTRTDIEKVVDEKVKNPVMSAELKAQLADINGRLQQVAVDTGRVQTDLSALRGDFSRIDSGIGTITADISRINTSLASNTRDIATIRTDVTRIDADVVVIKGDIGRVNVNIGSITTSVARINSDVATLSTRVGTVSTDVNRLNTDMSVVNGRVDGLQTRVGTLNVPINPGGGPGRVR
jgi:hypothetical protein